MQDNHMICYESRKLKEHEKNYATHDLELAAIVHALKMWSVTANFTTHGGSHLWPSLSLCKLFRPHGPFLYL